MHISSTTALKQAPYVALIKKGIYEKYDFYLLFVCVWVCAKSAAQFWVEGVFAFIRWLPSITGEAFSGHPDNNLVTNIMDVISFKFRAMM